MADKSPIFIRPYHVREKDKKVIDKENETIMLFRDIKRRILPYSSPVILISRKLKQNKRLVMDFRHLNVRIAKNNLAYLLVRDLLSVLGNSKCKVLSVLNLKDTFHSLRLSQDSKRYCSVLPYFGSTSYIYQENAYGIEHLTFHMAVLYNHNLRVPRE